MKIEDILQETSHKMAKISQDTQHYLESIQVHKITPKSIEGVKVNVYDTMKSIKEVARCNSGGDPKTLLVEPFDRGQAAVIESALRKYHEADFNIKRSATGAIYVSLRPVTEERRKKLAKDVRQKAEERKILIRNKRIDAKKELKNLSQEEGSSEDELKKADAKLQKITEKYSSEIEKISKEKERSLLTI